MIYYLVITYYNNRAIACKVEANEEQISMLKDKYDTAEGIGGGKIYSFDDLMEYIEKKIKYLDEANDYIERYNNIKIKRRLLFKGEIIHARLTEKEVIDLEFSGFKNITYVKASDNYLQHYWHIHRHEYKRDYRSEIFDNEDDEGVEYYDYEGLLLKASIA